MVTRMSRRSGGRPTSVQTYRRRWSSVPRPRGSAGSQATGAGWFDPVPAYRLATFRVALAVTTIVFHVPKFNAVIDGYAASAFHVPPALSWIPPLTPWTG